MPACLGAHGQQIAPPASPQVGVPAREHAIMIGFSKPAFATPPDSTSHPGPSWRYCASAAVLGALAYVNSLHNPFVYDDQTEILRNPSIRALSGLAQLVRYSPTRPLTNVSYAVDYAFTAVDPLAYHLTNVVLHVVAVVLLFLLMRRVIGDVEGAGEHESSRKADVAAFAASSLFAVHPMMTEAVGYTSARAELLCAVFFLGGIIAFRHAFTSQRPAWLTAGIGLLALALASKETGVMLPFVLLAYDRLIVCSSVEDRRWRLTAVCLPLVATVAALGAVRIWMYVGLEHPATHAPFWRAVAMDVYVTGRYLGMLAFPYHQTIMPSVLPIESVLETRVLIAAMVVVLLIRGAYVVRKRLPVVTFGIAWFVLLLLPSAALLILSDIGQPMAEHRVYLASCGVFMAVGGAVSRIVPAGRTGKGRRLVTHGTLAVVLAVLLALTVQRNRVWGDPIGLWQEATRRAPRTWMAHFGLADAYRQQGNLGAAAASYERAIAIRPDRTELYMDLVNVLIELRQFDRAKDVLGRAFRASPCQQ